MESFHELDNILSTMDKDEYFIDILNTKSLEAGIIRLKEDQRDTQTSHPLDELYYVINGEGYISVEGNTQKVRGGTVIFVPANRDHCFYGNKEELIVLYVFPKRN